MRTTGTLPGFFMRFLAPSRMYGLVLGDEIDLTEDDLFGCVLGNLGDQ
jgi:hypothetical protein